MLRMILAALAGFALCAIIARLSIGGLLSTEGANSTPLSLQNVHSLRVRFTAEVASSASPILTGEGAFVADKPDQPPDVYLEWRAAEPPTQGFLLLAKGQLYTKSRPNADWQADGSALSEILRWVAAGSGAGLPLGQLLIPLSGLSISADMPDWERLPDEQQEEKPVRRFRQSNLDVTLWQIIFPQYRALFRSASAEIAIGQYDHLPQRTDRTHSSITGGSSTNCAPNLTIVSAKPGNESPAHFASFTIVCPAATSAATVMLMATR
jgi:hypothetical protein